MGFDYKMKKSENGGILRGFWAIAVLWLVIWREQNCSSGGKKYKKIALEKSFGNL